jgi:diguanylate cyclase
LVDATLTLLQRYDVAPSALRLEITESALMRDAARTREILMRLAEAGVRLAVDDFGMGYSSLSYLKHLPVEEIKIDRSFVQDMASDPANAAIIRSTIGLGHGLGLRVVAEGVETAATWEQLREGGCDGAQGDYISRPLSGAALAAWLAHGAWAPT